MCCLKFFRVNPSANISFVYRNDTAMASGSYAENEKKTWNFSKLSLPALSTKLPRRKTSNQINLLANFDFSSLRCLILVLFYAFLYNGCYFFVVFFNRSMETDFFIPPNELNFKNIKYCYLKYSGGSKYRTCPHLMMMKKMFIYNSNYRT